MTRRELIDFLEVIFMHEQLCDDLHSAAFQIGDGELRGTTVVCLADVDNILCKHKHFKLGEMLKIIASSQMVALKAESTLVSYDFIGTAKSALDWGVQDAFKNISDRPFDMDVTKIDIVTGIYGFTDLNGNKVNEPTILIFIK